jgi:hypothetical protein
VEHNQIVVILVGPCKERMEDEDGYRVSRTLERAGLREICRTHRVLNEDDLRLALEILAPPDEELARRRLTGGQHVALLFEGQDSTNIARLAQAGRPEIALITDEHTTDRALEAWFPGIQAYVTREEATTT